jgi:hypothetical protein
VSNCRGYSLVYLTLVFGAAAFAGCGETQRSAPAEAVNGADSRENPPATSAAPPKLRIARAIDLRTLPQFEQAKLSIRTADRLEGTASGTAAAILAYYRAVLEKLGWKLGSPLTYRAATDDSGSVMLEKGSDAIFLSVIPNVGIGGKVRADEKSLSIASLGACDSSKLPRLRGAENGYSSRLSTVYFTDMKVDATAASVRTMLEHEGWQPFAKPYAIKSGSSDIFRDEYRRQGNSLRVLVSTAPTGAKKIRSSVEYFIGAIGHQMPAPPDATEVEFDDTLCLMQCKVPRELQPVADFYRGAMADLGFEGAPAIPANEAKAVVVFKAKDQEVVILQLNYDWQNTHVELTRKMPEAGKKAGTGGNK